MPLLLGLLDRDPYWSRPWPSAVALATQLLLRPALVAGRRVVEVGAGLGVAGLSASLAGAASVTLTDREELSLLCAALTAQSWGLPLDRPPAPQHAALFADVADRLYHNTSMVSTSDAAPVGMASLDWHALQPEQVGAYDVVLCCDVLYEPGSVAPVAEAVATLLATEGRLLLADPPHRAAKNRERFMALLKERGGFLFEEIVTTRVDVAGKESEVLFLNVRRGVDIGGTVGVSTH